MLILFKYVNILLPLNGNLSFYNKYKRKSRKCKLSLQIVYIVYVDIKITQK